MSAGAAREQSNRGESRQLQPALRLGMPKRLELSEDSYCANIGRTQALSPKKNAKAAPWRQSWKHPFHTISAQLPVQREENCWKVEMNANYSCCRPAESLWMKSDTAVLKARVSVVWLQSHAFQEVSSQEIFLFKPSAIHEPHFWNEPTKLSQPHSFNKTPTTVCPVSKQQPAQFHWFSAWCYYTTGISNTNITGKNSSLLYPFHTNIIKFFHHLIFSLNPDLWITAQMSALFGDLKTEKKARPTTLFVGETKFGNVMKLWQSRQTNK